MSSAVANIEIGATTTRLMRGLAAAGRAVRSFAAGAARGLAGIKFSKKESLGEFGKSALGNFAGGMLGRGVDVMADAARDTFNLERALVRFQITTNGTSASTNRLRQQVTEVSRATAIARGEVLAGSSQYVALTGDAAGAAQAMSSFARIAQASGASVGDVASATASFKTSMGLQAGDIEAAFSAMIVQGKEGAVEIKDLAGELASLAPAFAQFRDAQGLGGIRELGAAMQVVMKGAGSASEAATQLQSLMGALSDTEVIRKLKQVKINVFDKDPRTGLMTLRSASDIFEDLANNQKLADPRVVAAIFGRKEAQMAIRSIRSHIGLYGDLRESAKDTGAVQRDLNTLLHSDAGKIESAFNNAKIALANAFTPERIEKFASALGKVADLVSKIVDGIENLFDDAGISELYAGDIKGAAAAKYMKGADRMSAEEMRAKADEHARKAMQLEAARDSGQVGWDQSDQLEVEGRRRAAAKLKSRADAVSSQEFAAATVAQAKEFGRIAGLEFKRQTNFGIDELADAMRNQKLEVGKKEVVSASKNSSQHSRGPAR